MPTLNSIVRQVLAIDPSAPAIEYQKQWHSWGDLSAIIDAIEGILRANGIGAGTEIGVTEPQATFSTCFGAPFMPRHPSVYGNLLKIGRASCRERGGQYG